MDRPNIELLVLFSDAEELSALSDWQRRYIPVIDDFHGDIGDTPLRINQARSGLHLVAHSRGRPTQSYVCPGCLDAEQQWLAGLERVHARQRSARTNDSVTKTCYGDLGLNGTRILGGEPCGGLRRLG